jgi:hypothetical protein
MEGTCFLCYYRIHSGHDSVHMRVGDRWRPVHRSHADEGKITIHRIARNVIDEVIDEVATIL